MQRSAGANDFFNIGIYFPDRCRGTARVWASKNRDMVSHLREAAPDCELQRASADGLRFFQGSTGPDLSTALGGEPPFTRRLSDSKGATWALSSVASSQRASFATPGFSLPENSACIHSSGLADAIRTNTIVVASFASNESRPFAHSLQVSPSEESQLLKLLLRWGDK